MVALFLVPIPGTSVPVPYQNVMDPEQCLVPGTVPVLPVLSCYVWFVPAAFRQPISFQKVVGSCSVCFVPSLLWFGLVWFGLVWFGLVWFGLVWSGLVWFGLVWFGLVWFGLVTVLGQKKRRVPTSECTLGRQARRHGLGGTQGAGRYS